MRPGGSDAGAQGLTLPRDASRARGVGNLLPARLPVDWECGVLFESLLLNKELQASPQRGFVWNLKHLLRLMTKNVRCVHS